MIYGTEEKCRAAVIASRRPKDFERPVCGGQTYSEGKTRGLFQCSARQVTSFCSRSVSTFA